MANACRIQATPPPDSGSAAVRSPARDCASGNRGRPSVAKSGAITQAILAQATELFLANGYEQTTIDAIAARAGVLKRTLYKRYPAKDQLLRAVLQNLLAKWSDEASVQNATLTADLRRRLAHHLASIILLGSRPQVQAVRRLCENIPIAEAGLRGEIFDLGRTRMVNLIASDISEFGPAQNIVARDSHRIAGVMVAAAIGWLDAQLTRALAVDEEAARQAANEIVRFMMDGTPAW